MCAKKNAHSTSLGLDGVPGRAGADGISGKDGKDGMPGIDGKNGINGKDGKRISKNKISSISEQDTHSVSRWNHFSRWYHKARRLTKHQKQKRFTSLSDRIQTRKAKFHKILDHLLNCNSFSHIYHIRCSIQV